MYDYDYEEDEYGFGPPPKVNLIGKIKAKTAKAALFELAAVDPYTEYPEDFEIGGEQWLPLSQIETSSLQSPYNLESVPEELKDFVKIIAPLWLANKFKSRFKGKIVF
jgi:hypothetical protein